MWIFSVLNVFIVCIRNTVVFKLIPLLCTHVYPDMFSTVHPQGKHGFWLALGLHRCCEPKSSREPTLYRAISVFYKIFDIWCECPTILEWYFFGLQSSIRIQYHLLQKKEVKIKSFVTMLMRYTWYVFEYE